MSHRRKCFRCAIGLRKDHLHVHMWKTWKWTNKLVETDKERASEIRPKDVSTKFKKENKNSWYHSLVTKHKQTWWRGTHIRIGFLALLFFNWTVYGLYIKYQNRKGLDWCENSDWLKKRQKGRDASYQTCRVGIGFLTLYIIKKGKNFWLYFLWYFYQLFGVTLKIKKKKVLSFTVTINFLPF